MQLLTAKQTRPSVVRRSHSPALRVECLESRELLAANILVSELYYAPTAPTTAELAAAELAGIGAPGSDGKDFQFLEIYNAGETAVDVGGFRFTQGFNLTIPAVQSVLEPHGYAVVVANELAFRLRFGSEPRVLGQFTSGTLSTNGERVKLVDNLDVELVDFDYSPTRPWPNSPNGNGASLVLIDPDGTDPTDLNEYFVWRGSKEFGGSPGVAGVGSFGIIINEILTHTDAPITLPDSVELFNSTDVDVDVSGWYLSDSFNNPLAFELPAGTIIAAGDYVTFTENDFDPTPENPGPNDFRLSGASGDEVILTKSDGAGGVEFFIDNVDFGGAVNGESFGRLPNGTGQLAVLSHNSFGCANYSARVGPVIVSEIVYNLDIALNVLALQPAWGKSDIEFVEIHNPTNTDVDLTEWRLRGDVDFDFPAGEILPAGETLLVTKILPSAATQVEAFRLQYGLAAGAHILGPWSGSLGNSGGRVELQHPDEPPSENPTFFPRLTQDLTIYDDRDPWPEEADGGGHSLQRVAPYLFGNDPRAWKAAIPTPGSVTYDTGINGDFNADGKIDAVDIDILRDFVRSGVQVAEYDVSGDVIVNENDVNTLIFDIAHTQSGDANFDGVVDTLDIIEWHRLRDRPCGNWSSGDFNGDQFIDDSDFSLWSLNKFTGALREPLGPARTPRAPLGSSSVGVLFFDNAMTAQDLATDDRGTQHVDFAGNSAGQSAVSEVRYLSDKRFRHRTSERHTARDSVFADESGALETSIAEFSIAEFIVPPFTRNAL